MGKTNNSNYLKTLKRLNNVSLLLILLLIIIYLLFDEHLTGNWNIVYLVVLAIAVVGSVVVEILIHRRKKSG